MAIEKIEPLRIKLTKLLPDSSLLCVALHNLLEHLLLHINVLLGQPVLLSLPWKKVPGGKILVKGKVVYSNLLAMGSLSSKL